MSSSPDSFESKVRITVDADGVASEVQEASTKVDGLTSSLERAGASADGAAGKMTATATSVSAIGTASQNSAAKLESLSSSLKNLNQMGTAGSGGSIEGPILSARELAMVQEETHSKNLAAIDAEKIAENQKHQDNLANIRKTGSADGQLADMNKANIQAAVQAENQRHKRELSNIADKKTAANSENRTRATEIKRVALEEQKGAEQVAAAKKAASEKAKAAAAQELAERKKQLEIEKQIAAQRAYAATRTSIGGIDIPRNNYSVAGVGVTPEAASQVSLLNQKTQELNRTQEKNLQGLSNARYALYDVAATWRMVGIAATGATAAMVATAASFESAFTGVERTVDVPVEQMGKIRDDLLNLTSLIPESFPDLSNIATIGGQLDIAGSNIVSFTENVAKFSAMTDASIDDTAMSFGRIDQLANSGIGSFDNIASSVYGVGVQTVATETQIMKMSQELSATASLAGFTAQEIIGLSGALASLGAAPERSRGAIEKTFATITNAVQLGGEELAKFANIAGVSAADFAQAWKTSPAEAFQSLLTGMSTLDNLNMALEDLGLNERRTADIFKRLAGNMDIVNHSLEVSANAWNDHSAFTEAYGLVSDDLSSVIKMLGNDVLALVDSLTDTSEIAKTVEVIRAVVGAAQDVVDFIDRIPLVGKAFQMIVPGVMGAVSVFALYKAAALTVRASAYAVMTAQAHLNKNTEFTAMKFRDLIRVFTSLKTSVDATKVSEDQLSASTHNLGNAATATTGKLARLSVGARTFATNLGLVRTAALGAVGGLNGLVGIGILGGLTYLSNEAHKAKQAADDLEQAFRSVSSGMAQDTLQYERTGEAMSVLTINQDGVTMSTDGVQTSQGQLINTLAGVAEVFGLTTNATREYTIALGENAQQAIIGAIMGNEQLVQLLREIPPELQQMGISAEGFASAVVNNTVPEFLEQLRESLAGVREDLHETSNVSREASGYMAGAMTETREESFRLRDALDILSSAEVFLSETMLDMALEMEVTRGVMGDLEDESYDAANGITELANTMIASLEGTMAFEQAMFNLGRSMAENGDSFDIYSESGRANMSSLSQVVSAATKAAGSDTILLANMLAEALSAIGGVNTAIGMSYVQQAQAVVAQHAAVYGNAVPNIVKLAESMNSQSAAAGRNAAANKAAGSGARKAGSGAKAAAAEIRTLTDYVKDLSSVMKNAFEFRWGLEKSIDSAADAFQKLQDMKTDALERVQDAFDKFEDSEQKIKDLRIALADLQADINGLSADKGTLEYQLQVARDYGDSLREKEILAQLEKNQADMAKAESDRAAKSKDLTRAERDQVKATQELSDAQRDAKRDLSGTTASSREQRSAVLALVSSYQDQVEQLANSGLSSQQLAVETEKLRQKFIAQMLQLGYSRAEAEKYSQSFRDMIVVINQIPRNITISANVDPAQRAINEFRAKNTGGKGLSAPITVPVNVSTAGLGSMNYQGEKLRRYNEYLKAAALYQQALNPYNPQLAASRSSVMSAAYNAWKNYYEGGFTGKGGKYEVKGLVHGGEFVFRKDQVDQSTGLPYVSALGEILAGSRSSGGGGSRGGSGFPNVMVVELSPVDRKLIQDSGHAIITLDGQVLAASVNSRNANTSGRGL